MLENGIPDARLPVEPSLAQQFAQYPGVNVAASVVPHVDDETLTVVDGIELPCPLLDVRRTHGAEMNISNL
ncbi:MAG: hypothetical protein WCB11_30020 [Terriglobales bacterium]